MITDIRLLRNKIIEKQFSRMNDMQFDAVTSVNGPLLILAGAGSGKTTVLVNRIAYLISFGNAYNNDKFRFPLNDEDIELLNRYYAGDLTLEMQAKKLLAVDAPRPWEVLAITFTNKAANELKERLTKILGVVFFVIALFCTFLLAFMVSR